MPKIIENRLKEAFKGREAFSKEDLFDFFRDFEPNLKEGTLAWRIYDLKNKNIIKSLKRGVYTISGKQAYAPGISEDMLKLSKRISEQFEEVNHCVWDTTWLNEFSQHQSGVQIILIEIEKEFTELLFYDLKDNFGYDFFLTPDETTMDLYVSGSKHPVIIKKLITRSPIEKRTVKKIEVATPYLEKILVDIFAEEKLFYFYQGAELMYIYENAIRDYTLNFTTLFSYAKRRGKERDIKLFIKNNMPHLVKGFIDD